MIVCLCLLLAAALRLSVEKVPGNSWRELFWGASPQEEQPPLYNGETLTLTGQVYQKDEKYFYLYSVTILQNAADSRQNIPFSDKLAVEQGEIAEEQIPLGGVVTLQGTFRTFSRASNPGEFDSAGYYQSMGICGKLSDIRLLREAHGKWPVRELLWRLRRYWTDRLYRIFPKKEAALMSAVLLGDKTNLDGELKALYQRNGIIHILSISGLHITVIGMGIYRLFRRMGIPVWLSAVLGSVILAGYGVLTGMGVSACRAIGMYLIRMLGELAGRTYDMLTAWSVMAVVMVVQNPLYLRHSGFLLSYLSVLGLGTLYPVLEKQGVSESVKYYEKKTWRVLCKEGVGTVAAKLRQSLLAGLSVLLITLPVQLWFYYEVPTYSLLINLAVIPLMSILLPAGLIAMLIPGLGIVGTVPCVILRFFEKLCKLTDSLPGHLFCPGRPKLWQIVLYYGALLSAVWLMAKSGKRAGATGQTEAIKKAGAIRQAETIKRADGPKSGRLRKFAARNLLPWAPAMLAAVFVMTIPQGHQVTILDVGQGDCICVQTKGGEAYLFDCGSSSRGQVGTYVLKPFLKYSGVDRINAVFLSHGDEDHVNGIAELLRDGRDWGIRVDTLVLSGSGKEICEEGREGEYGEILAAAKEGGCVRRIVFIGAGESWKREGITFLCLHPPAVNDRESADSGEGKNADLEGNAGSQCFYIDFGVNSLLLTGDVEGEGERMLEEQMERYGIESVSVLKTAHHGSRNSTSERFLERAAPALSVISCGRGNRYGHPHRELLERLERAGCSIVSTQKEGAVTLLFGEDGVRVSTFWGKTDE